MGRRYIPQPIKSVPGEDEARLLDRVPDRRLSKKELGRYRKIHERISEAMKHAKAGNIQWANGEYSSLKREAQGMDYNDNIMSHLKELKVEIDDALEKNEYLKKVNNLWTKMNEGMAYAESGDFNDATEVMTSVRDEIETIKKNPDLRLEYERLQDAVDCLFAEVVKGTPEIIITDIEPKSVGKDGMREKCPVIHVAPDKDFFKSFFKKKDEDDESDYNSWDEIQDDSI